MPELVSCTPGRQPSVHGVDYPCHPSLSDDGDRIAFSTAGSDLVDQDTNHLEDVFVRSRSEGVTRRQAENAISPCLSADGSQLAYVSPGADGVYTLYLKDLRTGETRPLTHDGEGRPFTWANYPQLSGDGQVVLFQASTERGTQHDLYRYDRRDGTCQILDVGSSPASVSLSFDGAKLAVGASRLPGGNRWDTGGWSNIYLKEGGETRLLTHSPHKTSSRARKGQWAKARGWSSEPALSADGNWVAYLSDADNLVARTRKKPRKNVYITEVATEKTERVSVSDQGQPADEDCFDVSISADGRFVSFESRATNLTPEPADGKKINLFVRDRKLGRTFRVNLDGDCQAGRLSADGNWLTYVACADPDGPEEAWTRQVYVVGNPASEHTQAVNLQTELAHIGASPIRRLQGAVQIGGVQLPVRP